MDYDSLKCGIGERLKEFRKLMRLDQEDIAKKINVSRSLISLVENGIKNPSFEMLTGLQIEYNVDINWLLMGKGEMFVEVNMNETENFLKKYFGKITDDHMDILNAAKDPVLRAELVISLEIAKEEHKQYLERKLANLENLVQIGSGS